MSARPDRRWSWLDLRLVPVAAAVWAVTLAAGLLSPPALLVLAGAATLAALLLVRRRGRAGVLVLLAVLAAVATTATVAAVRGAARAASPLADVAAGRTVDAVLKVDGDPRRVAGTGPPRLVLDVTVTAVTDRAATVSLTAGAVLFAPAPDWTGVLPGQVVRTRVAVATAPATDGVVARLSARGPPEPVEEPSRLQRAAGAVRDGLAATARRVLPAPADGLLPGLVVGDTRGLDPVLEEDFRRAGLSHLTAVSGANVAIVLTGVLAPLRRRAVDRRVQAVVALAVLAGFVVLVRPDASVLRAAAMGAVTLLALASGRARAAVPALAASVAVLLLLDPRLARDAGFALSVAATAAIVLLAPRWSHRLRRRGWPRTPADAVAVAAAAGLATAPLVAGLSGLVSPVSLPANLLAAPAVAPATVLGLLAAVVGPVVPEAGDGLVWLAGWPVRWLVAVARTAAALPDGATGWPAGTGGALLLTVLLLAAGLALWRYRRLRPVGLAALLGLVLLGWPLRQVADGWPPPGTVLVACDVGQGDALVLPTGPGEAVLVDAGPEVGAVDRCLDRLGVDRLPLVLLSHLDADHVGGLAGALDGREVGAVATGTLSPADDRAGDLARAAARAGARREVLVPGDRRDVGGARLEVLAPPPEIATAAAEPNDLSLVVRVTVRGVRVLLTGDLSAAAEARVLDRGVDLRADVLKVPHHGSADVDPAFLAATGARVALVSVGAENTYGHPAPRLLSLLARDGVRVHRTDREGDLAVVGSVGEWGVAARGAPGAQAGPVHPGDDGVPGGPAVRPDRRRAVTPSERGSGTPGTDLPPAGRRRRGGAAALPRRRRRARRRPRAPPRRGGARAGRRGPAGRAARRRAGAVAVRRAPPGRRQRGARGRGRPGRRPDRLLQGPRPGAHAGRRPPRRQAQRGAGQGVHRGRCGARRVRQDLLARRPGGVRPQRGARGRRPDHPRRGGRPGRRRRRGPAGAVVGGHPAGRRLRRDHRRRRRRPLPPRAGRGHRLHRRREGAGGGPSGLAGDAALGAGPRRRARAHRRRDRRRHPDRGPGHLAEHHQHR
ncbi:hypothetical protein GCM10027261_05330 [Geodermatophilus arenarius]